MVVYFKTSGCRVLGDEEACGQKAWRGSSTKMLFPMMLMFIAVILIVATPAVLTLTGQHVIGM